MKRLFDLAISTAVLVLTAPVCAVCAALVKLSSRGPVLYRAPRAGRRGEYFNMYKFRTMRTGLDTADRMVTDDSDDRITAVGSMLRKTKLDELPQMFNVIRGEMSIVGPRPEDWGIVSRYYTDEQRRTLDVRPGIASYAELRWYPDLTYHDPPAEGVSTQSWYIERHMPVQLAESVRYIEEQSTWLDLKILIRIAWNVIYYSFASPPKRPLGEGR